MSRINQLDEESRAGDKRLEKRIDTAVSAMGKPVGATETAQRRLGLFR